MPTGDDYYRQTRGNLGFGAQVKYRRNAAWTVTNGNGWQAVPLDTAVSLPSAQGAFTLNANGWLVVPVSGLYLVFASLSLGGGATGYAAQVSYSKNPSGTGANGAQPSGNIAGYPFPANSGMSPVMTAGDLASFAAGDTVALAAWINGASISTSGQGNMPSLALMQVG